MKMAGVIIYNYIWLYAKKDGANKFMEDSGKHPWIPVSKNPIVVLGGALCRGV